MAKVSFRFPSLKKEDPHIKKTCGSMATKLSEYKDLNIKS